MGKVRSGEELKAYRESYNYRREYFKRNPGLFGCIWFCSQCYKPLFGKHNVYIDHIVPLAQGGINHVSNCTAICRTCNLKKSDKVDGRVLKGAIFKFIESNVFRGQRGAGAALAVGAGLTAGAVNGTAHVAGRAGKGIIRQGFKLLGKTIKGSLKLVTYPIRKGSIISRLFFIALYTLAIMFILTRYTNILDAWL